MEGCSQLEMGSIRQSCEFDALTKSTVVVILTRNFHEMTVIILGVHFARLACHMGNARQRMKKREACWDRKSGALKHFDAKISTV